MTDMPKAYDFSSTEQRLYHWWEENGWFKPETRPANAKPFTISIPPPNVTGQLHMGHAMFVALEDLMIRRARMQGRAALWVPGTDHAGIATQLQVENLLRSEGTSREEVGREEFLRRTWAWKEEFGGRIVNQLRRLGASCDWERERFTLDEGLSEAVKEAFVRLYRMGLIYQAEYLVNWSPGLQTAVSDLEVDNVEEEGKLYHFKYPIKGGGHIPVATTRPETILGDTAVAVHPDDERYQTLIGMLCIVPGIGREIPIIADEYVDMSFGSGALKVTPGHDPNDFEIGQRHNLPIVNVMNKDATMNENAGDYAGLDRFECRQKLWADMEADGLVIEVKPHTHTVPRSQRGGEIIEPLVSRQWFVNMEPAAQMGLDAVHRGRIKIVPERFVKVWDNWLENIRPWCISRQLWWGHRIPAWYVNGDESKVVVARSEAEAREEATRRWGEGVTLEQDDDVLDTWFSSGLWPFSTLGWPEDTPDLQRFYPTDVMETGYDILFFWVARMVMQGLLFTNDIPFHTVYLHGLVRDEHGRKMSKSLGNVTDPLIVMDQFGTDALRFTLLTGGTPGNDLNLAISRVESNRNFANKIWNATRFVVHNLDKVSKADKSARMTFTDADKWILDGLTAVTTSANQLMENFQFGEAGRQVYDFLWGDFTDWYVELSKVQLNQDAQTAWTTLWVLRKVIDDCLRLLHPYIPYVTEETWQQLKGAFETADLDIEPDGGWGEALIIADWPTAGERYPDAASNFDLLKELVTNIRATRAEYKVPPAKWIPATISCGDKLPFFESQRPILAQLARLADDGLTLASSATVPDNAATISLGDVTCYLPLAGMVDLGKEKERLQKELADIEQQIKKKTGLLNSPFAEKAPPAVVQKERDALTQLQASQQEIEERLAGM